MRKRLTIILSLLGIIIIGLVGWGYIHLKDRHPGYEVSLNIEGGEPIEYYRIGFSAQSITPPITDTWTDIDQNAKYEPNKGDTYEDINGNGTFDAYWIAGFGKKRAAAGVNDSLWARAMVIDDGKNRFAWVVLDAIGFGHDDVVRVRKLIPEDVGITYTTVISTHTHQSPDLVGLWGPTYLGTGINKEYMEMVQMQAATAVIEAVSNIQPAKLFIAEDLAGAIPLVNDSRKPYVLDPGLRVLQAVDTSTQNTLGSVIVWANHPETVWSKNLMISSDFSHYVRDNVEQGVFHSDSLIRSGIGGISLYINGAIGGLMTTDPKHPIQDPFEDTTYLEPSFEKVRAQGQHLALLALSALDSAQMIDPVTLTLKAKTLLLPLDNPIFRLGAFLGVLNRGMSGWMKLRTEVGFWKMGTLSCIQVPGEIYPEIVNGGIEAPLGQDFEMNPLETPPLRSLMKEPYTMVFGLANDLIGYIIPQSEWDNEKPYLYGDERETYGEINSVGPETAPRIYKELSSMIIE